MTANRKQSLRALVRSRGLEYELCAGVWGTGDWTARLEDPNGFFVGSVRAPTRRAALAGLRAVLEAMPERKVKR